MKKWISIFSLITLAFSFNSEAAFIENEEVAIEKPLENMVTFTPPKGWKSGTHEKLPPTIKALVVGVGKSHFPPSMSLSVEPFKGTLKDYLKIVKNINIKAKTEWKEIGTITTKAGVASLSQFDEASNWGVVRSMTTILVKDGNTYILSATALQSEFSEFYKDFFTAMSSLDISQQ